MRLLLVEDDEKLARSVTRGLRGEGYAVDLAGDGDTALIQASVYDYDAIVLDVMLPGRDGFEVCRTLRERGCWSPLLMLTARDGVGDRIGGLDAGADDYLPKPFDFGELLARLRALVRRQPGQRPTRLDAAGRVVGPAPHAAGAPAGGAGAPRGRGGGAAGAPGRRPRGRGRGGPPGAGGRGGGRRARN